MTRKTESDCPLGRENATRIDNIDKDVERVDNTIDLIFAKLDTIIDKLDRRPPVWATLVMSGGGIVLGALFAHCLTLWFK